MWGDVFQEPAAVYSAVALVVLVLVLLAMSRPWRWLAMARAESGPATREIARAHGIRVEDVERVVALFDRRKVSFGYEKVVGYSIARLPGSTPPQWSFVMRTKKLGAQYPHGWVFRAESAPPPALDEVLRRIARECHEEFYEFEADESEVHAFWYEGGGAEGVTEMERRLRALAGIGRDEAAPGVAADMPAPQSPSAAVEEAAVARRYVPPLPAAVRLAVGVLWIAWFFVYPKRLLPLVVPLLALYVPRWVVVPLALVGFAAPIWITNAWKAVAARRRLAKASSPSVPSLLPPRR